MAEKEQDTDFQLSIRDPSLRNERKQMFKILAMTAVLITVAVWALLSVFWGSTCTVSSTVDPTPCTHRRTRLKSFFADFYRLKVEIYDFDSTATSSPLLGPTVVQTLQQSLSNPVHLGYIVKDATGVTYEEISNRVVNEKNWGAIIINANATANFRAAAAGTGGLSNGVWAPEEAISVVVASARWYQVVDEYLLPYLYVAIEMPMLKASQQAAASILSSATPATLAAFSATQQAALASPFSYQTIDLRPILPGQWAGAAPLEAGLIYYVIFAFHIALFLFFSRIPFQMAIKKKGIQLSWLHTVILRIAPLPFAYFFLSLSYSLINLAFLVPMDGNGHAGFGPQGGFMVFWMLNWLTLGALGTAMESMIILNITSSFFPPTLMEPFWHSTTAAKHIMWGARNRLGLNFGVLTAYVLSRPFLASPCGLTGFLGATASHRWVVLNVTTLSLFELMWRKIAERKERKEQVKEDGKTAA
ncbi:SPOSA6832_04393 [Sporobolomyces salmonicolor]|uniref:SPOSA6832_04393-mRNA-1:cds n=1 Tax=Sporidiobolus salmonicolor TaxID=5005 RepID=A0A0D6ERU5_SPOSA|nr:SPOSA6832_04393 [Sporobolomyces salmonicolor]